MRLCQLLRQSSVPAHVRNAATRHAMLIRPGEAAPILQELLSAKDDASFAMALTASRELDGPQVTQTLLASLVALPSSRAHAGRARFGRSGRRGSARRAG